MRFAFLQFGPISECLFVKSLQMEVGLYQHTNYTINTTKLLIEREIAKKFPSAKVSRNTRVCYSYKSHSAIIFAIILYIYIKHVIK